MPASIDRRPTPEELLRRVQAEERQAGRGRLKVFLGYASRCGKSFRMLDEGRRRKERGEDVVVATIQAPLAPELEALLGKLEVIPTLKGTHAGKAYEVLDVAAVFRRHPQVCLVDELAYDNPPGSRNPKRWQDVDDIRSQDIGVITAVNLQHIEEQQDAVERITGKRARHSVPESFLRSAEEIVLVDAALDDMMQRAGACEPVDIRRLSELRELALLLAADVIDDQLLHYLQSNGLEIKWGTQERILVCITPRSDAGAMLHSGWRNAQRFHGDLLVCYVKQSDLDAQDSETLEANLALARQLEAEVHTLEGPDPIAAILQFARIQCITQIFVGHSAPSRWKQFWPRSPSTGSYKAPRTSISASSPTERLMIGSAETPQGRLKIFLGYAAGVGKTFQMLNEAQELRRKGVDVVIGYFEPHARQDTIARTEGLEVVPRKTLEYRGAKFEEMDTDAILRRNPAVCLVDEFAHTNVPGSALMKRWEDVQALLHAGIDVFTTVNVQHLESLNDEVWRITGVRVRETLPDWVVDAADEVVLVDLTPRALQNRLERGAVYSTDKAKKAMEHFFTETNLTALREMALRHTAHDVEVRLSDLHTPVRGRSAPALIPGPARPERILICLTGRPSTAMLIRRGKRVADYLDADCLAVHVAKRASPRGARAAALEKHMNFARNLHIDARVLVGKDVAKTIVDFARAQNVSQIFLGRPGAKRWWRMIDTTVQRVVRLARDREITIVSERRR